MIRSTLILTIDCDHCIASVTSRDGTAARFVDWDSALVALDDAVQHNGWARRAGRLLCPACDARTECHLHGHIYAVDGWRLCACGRSIPAHTSTDLDPMEWVGCGMTWRLCGRCDHIDEVHITALDDAALNTVADNAIAVLSKRAVQPGGHLRQDVPAGLAPNRHQDNQENAMVEPNLFPAPVGGDAS